jgi:hypothetical protein
MGVIERDQWGHPMVVGAKWSPPQWQIYAQATMVDGRLRESTRTDIYIRFMSVYGYPPPFIFHEEGVIKAGPIIIEEDEDAIS